MEQHLRKAVEENYRAISSILNLFIHSPDEFLELLERCESTILRRIHTSLDRKSTYIDAPTLIDMVKIKGYGGVDSLHIAAKLGIEGLVQRAGLPSTILHGQEIVYLDRNLLIDVDKCGLFPTALFGFRAFEHTIMPKVVRINILTEKGDPHTGTGFVAMDDGGKTFVWTAKHNFFSATSGERYHTDGVFWGDRELTVTKIFAFEKIDVCYFSFSSSGPIDVSADRPLSFTNGSILEAVFSIGFPVVTIRHENPMLVHSGQINGSVGAVGDSDHLVIFSCSVAPGNSGGPVVNELGFVLGIVTDRIEIDLAGEVSGHYAFVGTEQIESEIREGNFKELEMHS